MATSAAADRLGRLTHQLWRLRCLLETLLYRLDVQRLVLESGRTRWVESSCRDLAAVIDEICVADLLRATCLLELSSVLGPPEPSTLTELCGRVEAPWDEILRDHQLSIAEIVAAVDAAGAANRELLGGILAEETNTPLSPAAPAVRVSGADDPWADDPAIVCAARRMACHHALELLERSSGSTLLDFLR